ncbi:MAG: alkaline phosphatase family protein [Steroidobacteraceae bacterium]
MQKRHSAPAFALMLSLALFNCATAAEAPQTSARRPKLVLVVVVDQMRYDYLTRYGTEFTGGLKRLLEQGAVFTNANYEAAPTVTAVGHSTVLSGATPSVSGIAGNGWFERSENKSIQSVSDTGVMPLGGGTGASPKRLLVSTVGDELKSSGKGGKVYGVSLKDRAAILPAGRGADGAFWFNAATGNFVSSTWYFDALPVWVDQFNGEHRADKYAGAEWMGTKMPATPGPKLNGEIDSTAFADQLVLDFALTAMKEEKLGVDAQTDLLSISFSAMDAVGHAAGPDTPAMHEMVRSIDIKVGDLLNAAEKQAGRGNVLLVFTADHGVSPVPEENIAKRLPGGRYDAQDERAAVEAALVAAFGEGKYIAGASDMSLYLNANAVPGKTLNTTELERVAAEALSKQPHVARVWTRTQLSTSSASGDRIDQRVRNGFNAAHSGDVLYIHEPNWLAGRPGSSTHGSPYSYDTHVPMIFWGPATLVRSGQYAGDAAVHDIAPTLAAMLGIATPSGSLGRVLAEIMPE